jgi:hypothetical protein
MNKQDIQVMPQFFDRYINLADDTTVVEALQNSLTELHNAPMDKWKLLAHRVYAPGKWTVKDILQHYIDTERVFTYRITAIARGDKQQMIPYNEDVFAEAAVANRRTLDDLLEELILIRKATILMFQNFTNDMLLQEGNGSNGLKYSPLALGFMLAGHQRWHFNILAERYYPLLEKGV